MSSKEVVPFQVILAVAVVLVLFFFFGFKVSPTGFFLAVTVAPEVSLDKVWDFANSAEYAYDAGKLNLSGGEVKLIPSVSTTTTTTTSTVEAVLSSAMEYEEEDGKVESEDKTNKVNSLGQGHVQLKDDKKVLGVTMAINLKNSDIFSVYLLNGSGGKLFICANSAGCSSADQGEISVSSGEEGWRNISISNVNSPQTTFYLDSPGSNPADKIKIDMVKGYNISVIEETTTTTTYPSSAVLETADLQPADFKRWGSFAKTETLNGQQLDYTYSTNSGFSWNALPATGDLSAVTATKLRVKATLISDGGGTPVLKSMKLNYTTQQPCTENWSCASWSPAACPANQTKTRACTDVNDCGTTSTKPAESQSCVYVPPCAESWAVQYGQCLSTNIQLKWYTDQNDCGTKTSLPADNGTSVSCDFCLPSWKPLNTSCGTTDTFLTLFNDSNNCFAQTGAEEDLATRPANLSWNCDYCSPVWTAQNTTCTPGDSFNTWYSDVQDCYAQTKLAGDLAAKPANLSQACDYCATHNCTESFQTTLNSSSLLNATTWFIDAREKTRAWLEITAPDAEGAVTILEYNYSRVNSNPSSAAIDLKKQLEINSTISNISSVKIILYYTDEELQKAGIAEPTLKIHYHNETSGQWQELLSIVNATGNYVYAVVDHLSLYGLFGNGPQGGDDSASSASSSGSSGSGSGGGGGRREESSITASTEVPITPEQVKEVGQLVLEKPATVLAAAEEATAEQPCNYVVEVTLPDQVSFLENSAYEGEIENKGDCSLAQVELRLSPELQPVLELPVAELEALKPGEKHSFTLIRKQSRREKIFSVITTLATAEEVGKEEITGLLMLNSKTADQTVYARELPLRVEIPAPLRMTSPPVIKMGIALVLLILMIAAVHWDKEERERLTKGKRKKNTKETGRFFNLPPFSLIKPPK